MNFKLSLSEHVGNQGVFTYMKNIHRDITPSYGMKIVLIDLEQGVARPVCPGTVGVQSLWW
jgi:hypothetical protein